MTETSIMAVPAEHLTYLQRKGYTTLHVAGLDEEEAALLRDYGHWMEALAAGWIAPVTAEQSRFVRVARGEAEPVTPFERVWHKVSAHPPEPPAVASEGLGSKLAHLAEVRRYSDELQARMQAERDAVLHTVQAQLDAIGRKYAQELDEAGRALAELEQEVKAEVLEVGSSVRSDALHAVYYHGSITWDSKALAEYAQAHPDVERFRKTGSPRVVIRYR
jgi:uncharacterized protein YifE (UPF0438 family)